MIIMSLINSRMLIFNAGIFTSRSEPVPSAILQSLQKELKLFYTSKLCFVRCVPWLTETIPIEDEFVDLSITYRKKTSSSRDEGFFDRSEVPIPFESFRTPNSLLRFVSEEIEGEELESMDNIFKIEQNGILPRRILICGEPGIGKSTLLLKIVYDWGKDSALKDSKLLFHLSLSGVTADADLGEEIVKQTLPNDTKLTACSIEECIRQHAGDVIILLDSFDESLFAFAQVRTRTLWQSLRRHSL